MGTLCKVHRSILADISTVQKLIKNKDIERANKILLKVKQDLRKAIKMGQRMENRLKKYFDAILGLGFTRNKD